MDNFSGSYLIKNLIQGEEILLKITLDLEGALKKFHESKNQVIEQQKEAHTKGLKLRKITQRVSSELSELEVDNENQNESKTVNLNRFWDSERRLEDLKLQLDGFVESDEQQTLENSDTSLISDLKKFEDFTMDLSNLINSKITFLEKILLRIQAETRESQQQKVLLSEMVELFNLEIDELEKTVLDLRKPSTISKISANVS